MTEPTEEQKQAARDFYGLKEHLSLSHELARFLAEREHKLRADIVRKADVEIGSIKSYIDHQDQLLKSADRKETSLRTDLDAARARIAELEAACGERLAKLGEAYEEAETGWLGDIKELEEREAQHLAHIKALHQFLGDHEEEEGIWIPRSEFKELPMRAAPSREAQLLADIKAGRKAVAAWLDDPWLEGRRKLGEDFMAATAHYDDAKADAPAVDWQAWANGSCPEPGCSLANPHEQGVACVKPTAEGGEG